MRSSMLHNLFWGLVLVAVGVMFLLNQTGMASIDIGSLIGDFWPVILIFFGLQGLLLQRYSGFWWNGIVILVGVVFLGRNLNWFTWDIGDIFRLIWPVILILFGLSMIARGNRSPRRRRRGDQGGGGYGWNPVTPPPMPERPAEPMGPPPAPPLSDDPNASFTGAAQKAERPPESYAASATRPPHAFHGMDRREYREQRRLERIAHHHERRRMHGDWWNCDPNGHQHHRFIGDIHLGQDYWELKPLSISHFIGDTTLDLTKAQIPLGETKIYVSCFIGDVKVFLPNDFGVGIQVVSSSLIGDVRVLDHKRGGFFNQMSVETPNYGDADKRVVLVVSSFIGDVRVTKVG